MMRKEKWRFSISLGGEERCQNPHLAIVYILKNELSFWVK
jgi:hypothetical protein